MVLRIYALSVNHTTIFDTLHLTICMKILIFLLARTISYKFPKSFRKPTLNKAQPTKPEHKMLGMGSAWHKLITNKNDFEIYVYIIFVSNKYFIK
jgi:hypothetical protein